MDEKYVKSCVSEHDPSVFFVQSDYSARTVLLHQKLGCSEAWFCSHLAPYGPGRRARALECGPDKLDRGARRPFTAGRPLLHAASLSNRMFDENRPSSIHDSVMMFNTTLAGPSLPGPMGRRRRLVIWFSAPEVEEAVEGTVT